MLDGCVHGAAEQSEQPEVAERSPGSLRGLPGAVAWEGGVTDWIGRQVLGKLNGEFPISDFSSVSVHYYRCLTHGIDCTVQ